MNRNPVLAEVVRSGFVEGLHRGAVVALNPDGSVAFATGDVRSPIFPRSANKPMQAAGMVRAGLPLTGELLALATASHSGEPFQLDAVRKILAGAGLPEWALQTPPDLPIDPVARADYLRAGGQPTPLAMNCSAKHAAMLVTAAVNDWPLDSYRDPSHPLQLVLRDTVASLAGEPVAATGVDGCGAPLFALSLTGLARAFAALSLADPGSAEHQVAEAMRAHPEFVAGTRRDVTRLIRAVDGLIAKEGAEGVLGLALPDGTALALKIDDGADRARSPVARAALRRLGVAIPELDGFLVSPVLGGGQPVGEIRAIPFG
ncbi:MAG TPA: asparaginase [Actinomycetes bacterium]|nr:asparaginase [Actinomycetes bacterium]